MPASLPKPAPEPVWVWKIGSYVMLKIPVWNDLSISVMFTLCNVCLIVEMAGFTLSRHRWHWVWVLGVAAGLFNFLLGAASVWAIRRRRRMADST